MKHAELHFEQVVGSTRGYFVEENPIGINLLIHLKNEGDRLLQLVVTLVNATITTIDVEPHSEFAFGVTSVQTIGIAASKSPDIGTPIGKGTLILIPNFSEMNLS